MPTTEHLHNIELTTTATPAGPTYLTSDTEALDTEALDTEALDTALAHQGRTLTITNSGNRANTTQAQNIINHITCPHLLPPIDLPYTITKDRGHLHLEFTREHALQVALAQAEASRRLAHRKTQWVCSGLLPAQLPPADETDKDYWKDFHIATGSKWANCWFFINQEYLVNTAGLWKEVSEMIHLHGAQTVHLSAELGTEYLVRTDY